MDEHIKTIDGITYTTRTLPATTGLVILPKLVSLFGEPVLKIMFATDGEERGELLSDPKVMAAVLHAMAANAADTDGLLVVKDLFRATSADKVKIGTTVVNDSVYTHFDTHFAGRYMHLAMVAMWIASCNFAAP